MISSKDEQRKPLSTRSTVMRLAKENDLRVEHYLGKYSIYKDDQCIADQLTCEQTLAWIRGFTYSCRYKEE